MIRLVQTQNRQVEERNQEVLLVYALLVSGMNNNPLIRLLETKNKQGEERNPEIMLVYALLVSGMTSYLG